MHRLLILTIICGGVLGCSGDKADTMTRQSPDSGAEPPAETLNETLAEESPSGAEPEDHPTPAAPASPGPAQPQTPTDDARSNGVTTIRVFYGTDRKQTGSSVPNKFYGGERGSLSVGFCDVSLPPGHQRGELEAPSIWRLEFRENPDRHVMLRSVQPVDGSKFLTSLRSTIESSVRTVSSGGQVVEVGGELFVFVHGYNVTFKDAARRTAQMAYDLEFPGAPVLFSWPSLGKGTLAGYREDERTAEWCEEHVMDFVTVIARESGARRIHLIAHSMGNRVLTGVLRRLAYTGRNRSQPEFNEVILTAPDVDADTFKLAIAPRITGMAERVTVYASQNDVALKASAAIHAVGSRLGQGGRSLRAFLRFPKIDMIDASGVDTSLFAINHSYYGDSPTVLNDIANVLIGARADSRGLKTVVPKAAWQVPTRLSRLSRRVH